MLLSSLAPITPPYKLFISHAWDYNDEYEGVVRLLNGDIAFRWKNLSVPIDNPIATRLLLPKSYRYILRQIEEKIKQSDCLLVLAAMYVCHRGWIQSEIEAANDFGKPIIAIRPRGQERVPEIFSWLGVREPVGWTTDSIISAIRAHASPSGTTPIPLIGGLRPPTEPPRPIGVVPIEKVKPLAPRRRGIFAAVKDSPYGSIPLLENVLPPAGAASPLNIAPPLLDLLGTKKK